MATMSIDERDAFLLERRLGTLAVARTGKGPLMAPIWYRYTAGGTVDLCMGGSSAKAHRLRAEGRATLSVMDDRGPYRYATVEGPVTITPLGHDTQSEILAMATRYLGAAGGERYAREFMARLEADRLHDGHGTEEVMVRITPERWRTEVLG